MLIAVVAIFSLNLFVIAPIAERSADDEAALLVLSAQTWVELPPEARPYFELELAESGLPRSAVPCAARRVSGGARVGPNSIWR